MPVRRNITTIVAYMIIIILGIIAILLSIFGLKSKNYQYLIFLFAIGPGTIGTGIYAWARGLGGHIENEPNPTFYFRWWDFLVILGIYILSIGIFVFLVLLFFAGGRY